VSDPEFDIGDLAPSAALPGQRAGVGGWVFLFLVLGLMIGGQLYGYFNRKPEGTKNYTEASLAFRMTIIQKEAFKRLAGTTGQTASQLDKTFTDELENVVSDVAPDRKKNSNAARLYVAMRHELGKPIKPEDIELLKKSKEPFERDFAAIYAAEKLSKTEAVKLTARFPKEGFTFLMARIHAFERAGDKTARKRFLPDSEVAQPMIAIALAACAFGLGAILLTIYVVLRLMGRWKPSGHPAGHLSARQADVYAGRAGLMLFAYLAIGLAVDLTVGKQLSDQGSSLLSGALGILAAVFLLTKGRRADGPSMKIFGFDKRKFWGDVVWGVSGFFANIPLFMCCAVCSQPLFSGLPNPEHPVSVQLQMDQSLPMLMALLVLASIMAPIFEEVCFRGTMTPAMERLFGGPLMGIVGSSVLFAAVHPTGIPAWPALAMIGSMAAMLVYQRRSLVSSIAFHAAHNCALLIMTVLLF
jgi:membrane protease YdiL (CAAX protease family)